MGKISPSSWRYNVIKQYRNRAKKFMNRATTVEGKMAWMEVINWFDDILARKRMNKYEAIAILNEDADAILAELEADGKRDY